MSSLRVRIICTEADPDTCDLLKFTLEEAGFEVVCFGSEDIASTLAVPQFVEVLATNSLLTKSETGVILRRIYPNFAVSRSWPPLGRAYRTL